MKAASWKKNGEAEPCLSEWPIRSN